MLEVLKVKQQVNGPILNKVVDITDFLFVDITQVHAIRTYVDALTGDKLNQELEYGVDFEVQKILNDDISAAEIDLTAGYGKLTLKASVDIGVGESLTMYRVSPLIQGKRYPRVGSFPAASHEGAIDFLTMQNQEQAEKITRCATVPITVSNFNGDLPYPNPGKALVINAEGTGLTLSDIDLNSMSDYVDDALVQVNEAMTQVQQVADLANAAIGNMPTEGIPSDYLRRKADNSAFEYISKEQLKEDLNINNTDIDPIVNQPVLPLGDITGTNVITNLATRAGKILTFQATSGQYADLDIPFNNLGNQTWEQIWCFTPAQVGVSQFFVDATITGCYQVQWNISATNIVAVNLSSNLSTWDLGTLSNPAVVSLNNPCWAKLEFTGTQYKLSISADGISYNTPTTITTATNIKTLGSIRLGAANLSPASAIFKGTIDLSKSSVKIAGGPNLINITPSPDFVKDRQYNAFFKGSVLDTVLPTATETVLRNIMIDFNIQPGRKFAQPANAKWDFNNEPTFQYYPDVLMNLVTINDMKLNCPATSGQYADLANVPFAPKAGDTWEHIWHITPTVLGVLQFFMSLSIASSNILLGLDVTNKVILYLSSTSSTWDIASALSSTVLATLNTGIYIKLERTLTQYILSTSSTGLAGSWTVGQTITSALPIYIPAVPGNIRLSSYSNGPTANLFKGIIDLNKSSVKVNGGRNLLLPEPDVYLNRIIYDTESGGNKYKMHYSQSGV
jgi:hypothetical protein